MIDCLLIQPPALKPSEPPLALAVLQASLQQHGFVIEVLDANVAAYHYLLNAERLDMLAGNHPSTQIKRALRHRQQSLLQLRSPAKQKAFARYCTAIDHLNRLLSLYSQDAADQRLTLGDYQHHGYSVFNPDDLELFASGQAQTLFHDYFVAELLARIKMKQPKMIAISINYLHQVFPAFELAGLLKQQFPEMQIIAGGGLITSWQTQLQQAQICFSVFDKLIFGPGEAPLADLLRSQIGDKYFIKDTSEIAFLPDYDFARLSDYFAPEPVLSISSSRGCYWQNCLFCPEATAPTHSFTTVKVKDFPTQLRHLHDKYAVRYFHLTDNAIPTNILSSLASQTECTIGLTWFGFVRFEQVLEDAEFVQRLAASGCRMLQLGLESGSQSVLDRLQKGIQLASVVKILQNLAAAGIATYVYIMLGTPGETEQDAELTREFLLQHAAKIGFLNLSIMNLPRASGLLNAPQNYGIASSQPRENGATLGLYHEFESSGDWDRSAARRFLNKRLLGSSVIREIVKRTPPIFTSNHAVFFANR